VPFHTEHRTFRARAREPTSHTTRTTIVTTIAIIMIMKLRSPRRLLNAIFRTKHFKGKGKGKGTKEEERDETIEMEDSTSLLMCSEEEVEEEDAVVIANTTRTTTSRQSNKSVSFSQVSVRQYNLIVGDNPYCKYPLSLGWNYTETVTVDVNGYERERAKRMEQYKADRVEPRLYQVPTKSEQETLLHNQRVDHYLKDVHMEQDYDDYDISKPQELSMYERRARLMAFGYTEEHLRQLERQRLVNQALQWKEGDTPCVSVSPFFVARYAR
jgi:hypothetical protein